MELGIFESAYGQYTFEEAAQKIVKAGFKNVQLNPFISGGKRVSPDSITKKDAETVRDIFEQKGIKIVAIGSYGRFISPDPDEKAKIIEDTKKWIGLARHYGANTVVTEVGSKHKENNWLDCPENGTEKTWEEVVGVYKELAVHAKDFGVNVAIEPHFGQAIKNAKDLKRLLKDVGESNLKIAYDPANSVNIDNVDIQEQIIEEAIELLADDIILVHAKDALINNNTTVFDSAGKGVIPYRKLFNVLKRHNYNGPILLEWVQEPDVETVKTYIEEQAALPYLIPLLKSDRELFDHITNALDLVHKKEGALDLKYRLLLSMVADALTRHPAGAIACGKEAIEEGASKEEVLEAIRVIFTAGGIPALIENFDLYREVILK